MSGSRPTERPPVIVAIDDDASCLARVTEELRRRVGADYRIEEASSGSSGVARLEALRAAGDEVALVLADQWMPDLTGAAVLGRVRAFFPSAKRGLLVEFGAWGDRPTADAILRAMAVGGIDYYVLKPWRSPDELFNRTIAEFLHEWSRLRPDGEREVVVVGPWWHERTHRIRDLLARNGIPHLAHASDSDEAARLLAGRGEDGRPVVRFHDGRVLVDPSDRDIADAFGMQTRLDREEVDVAIVGAGPAGLAAAVYAASEGLSTLVIEREAIGGQAGSSSLIRNYLGFSRGVSGAELAMRAYQQAWVFGATVLMMREVAGILARGDALEVSLAEGERVRAACVVLATGVAYRRLGVPALEGLTGAGVFYGASVSEAQALAGEPVVVIGGGNSAGQAAMHLSRYAASVSIVVRGPSLADSMSRYLIDEIDAAPNVAVRPGTRVVGGGGEGRLEWLELAGPDDARERMPAAALFVMIGARPHTDWLPPSLVRDRWGFVATGADAGGEGWPLDRPPAALETSMPGVFAVGDVRRSSVKRVASGVGEGAAAIQQVHAFLGDARRGAVARSPEPAGPRSAPHGAGEAGGGGRDGGR